MENQVSRDAVVDEKLDKASYSKRSLFALAAIPAIEVEQAAASRLKLRGRKRVSAFARLP